MQKIITAFFTFLLTTAVSFSQGSTPTSFQEPPKESPSKNSIVLNPDHLPEFKGGRAGLNKFLAKNMVYPRIAIEADLQGKCYIRFLVEKDGKISEIKVLKGVPDCSECDAEAVRVIRKMPKWIPAKHNGEKVRSYFDLPVNFTLN